MEKMNGFHLIELIVTLSIISILMALSFPLYTQYLTQAKRLEAESDLAKLVMAMEEYYLSHHTYREASLVNLHFPQFTTKKSYQLNIEATDDDNYLLTATPIGAQAKNDTTCATLTLQATGEKGIRGPGKIDECW